MLLLACPACARQYDVTGQPPDSVVRCLCEELLTVGWPKKLTGNALTCTNCGGAVSVEEEVCPYCRAKISEADRRQTTLCPGCYTRIDDDSKHCRACGLTISPQALTPLPADHDCPRCHGQLRVRALGVADVIECSACLGMWFTPQIFERVCRGAEQESHGTGLVLGAPKVPAERKIEPVVYIPCLTCGELMQRRQYLYGGRTSGVVIDICGMHGVWLDHQEMESIVEFIRSAGTSHRSLPLPDPKAFIVSKSRGNQIGRHAPDTSTPASWVLDILVTLGDVLFGR